VTIRKIEKERKANIDQALKTAQSKVGELTKSLEFWKSRSKALDVEITVLRVQMQKILSKSKNETQLIDKLKVIYILHSVQYCAEKLIYFECL